ncbi:MAG: host attachment protein [Thermodesulfovibrionales bacterium]|nr:host attachment protein [Thermodesulfovibrionales bacterium]
MNDVVIAADLGHFKAYRITYDPDEMQSPRIELIEAFDTIEGKEKISERYTDSPGAFRRKGGRGISGAGGAGERHSIDKERERRLVRLAAESIAKLLVREGLPKWHLCACKSINNRLISSLPKLARTRLGRVVKADLTGAGKDEILSRFIS